jgi:cystathionine gamma-synthase/cystathionine gamma-lyase/cystathionine beta-lyase
MSAPDDFNTRLIHAGEPSPRIEGAVSMPIFQSAMFEQTQADDEVKYIRYNNTPNHDALHEKIAAVEGTEAALVTGSGMGAISSALLSSLSAGDHLLIHDGCYGGTHALVTDLLPRMGVEHSFVSHESGPDDWAAALRPETQAFYTEGITNPLLDVHDLAGVAAFSAEHDLVSMIDNTFATPVNFRPAEHGFDLVLHSATKYYGGHSDLVAGVVAGREPLVERAAGVLKMTGATLDPHACFLLQRSLKTLGVRVGRQNEVASAVAAFLDAHDAVDDVRYPGLKTHPDHQRAQVLFDGFGGMIAFRLREDVDPNRFLDALTVAVKAPSLGGPETLITRPAFSSHADVPADVRRELGITDGLFRVSVGLEEPEVLTNDVNQALAAALPAESAA